MMLNSITAAAATVIVRQDGAAHGTRNGCVAKGQSERLQSRHPSNETRVLIASRLSSRGTVLMHAGD